MIKEKILKLAKVLNTFTVDEMVTVLEETENQIGHYIESLVQANCLKKVSEKQYLYLKNPNNRLLQQKLKFEALLNTYNEEYKIRVLEEISSSKLMGEYLKYQPKTRQKIEKNLVLFRLTENLNNKEFRSFIISWNQRYPDQRVLRCDTNLRNTYNNYGLRKFLEKFSSKSLPKHALLGIYFPQFINMYFSKKAPSVEVCLDKLKLDFLKNQKRIEGNYFPDYKFFIKKLNSEFMPEEIEYNRSYKRRSVCSITFQEAAFEYLNKIRKEKSFKTYKSYSCHIKKYSFPFFQNIKILDITPEIFNIFILTLNKEKHSTITIRSIINHTLNIINLYCQLSRRDLNVNIKNEKAKKQIRVLTDKEVSTLLAISQQMYPDVYAFISTILSTGLKQSEILAISWDKIDFKNKRILIDGYYFDKKIKSYTKKGFIRYIEISDNLAEVLKDWKNKYPKNWKYVFVTKASDITKNFTRNRLNPITQRAGIENLLLDNLRDTYVVNQIKQNISIIYIAQQLGYTSAEYVCRRYKSFLEKYTIQLSSTQNCLEII
ncbi:MAG: tyrosine-type recombinase/integrase [Candidatus Gastranaerophilales bacterium]|nr:tyrosine-type recombinase/integrase [Candidatus Gastranaerophilales bacterium]